MSKEVQVETVLLPCPFCGGQPKVFYELHDLDDYVVQCSSCGASSCPVGIRYDKDLAVQDWNNRTRPTYKENI